MTRAVAAAVVVIACAVLAVGCAGSGKKPTTSVRNTAAGPAGAGTLTRTDYVRVARASSRRFAIFPAMPGKRRCSIPDGAPSPMPLRGTCETSVHRRPTHEPSMSVSFTERWRRAECAPDLDVACSHPMVHHTWRVIEGEAMVQPGTEPHIYLTRSSGATAPQDYK